MEAKTHFNFDHLTAPDPVITAVERSHAWETEQAYVQYVEEHGDESCPERDKHVLAMLQFVNLGPLREAVSALTMLYSKKVWFAVHDDTNISPETKEFLALISEKAHQAHGDALAAERKFHYISAQRYYVECIETYYKYAKHIPAGSFDKNSEEKRWEAARQQKIEQSRAEIEADLAKEAALNTTTTV